MEQGSRCPHCEEIANRLDEHSGALRAIQDAFPVDDRGKLDTAGHRIYHERKIHAAMAEEQFWQELRLDLAKKGAWAVLVVVCGMVAAGVGAYFHVGQIGGGGGK